MKKNKYSLFQFIGGKSEYAGWIISHFPKRHTYIETCGGAGSVLIEKDPSPVEVYNDIDYNLVNFFRMCRDKPDALASLLLLSPYSRSEYEFCKENINQEYDLQERARQYAVIARQSMGGIWGKAWSNVIKHSRRSMGSSNSRWLRLPESILNIAARLSVVQIECMDVLKLIDKYDYEDALFYIDPPYYPTTRQKNMYTFEMDHDDHVNLLNKINNCQGSVILSGYDNDLYDKKLSHWDKDKYIIPCRSNVKTDGSLSNRPTRTEILWIKNAS